MFRLSRLMANRGELQPPKNQLRENQRPPIRRKMEDKLGDPNRGRHNQEKQHPNLKLMVKHKLAEQAHNLQGQQCLLRKQVSIIVMILVNFVRLILNF